MNAFEMKLHQSQDGTYQDLVDRSVNLRSMQVSPAVPAGGIQFDGPAKGYGSTVLPLPHCRREERIACGPSVQRQIMFLGDLLLILAATFAAIWMQNPAAMEDMSTSVGPVAVGMIFIPASLFIFDMYNMARNFSARDAIPRVTAAVVVGGLLCVVSYYLVLHWQFGRKTVVLQVSTIWLLILLWRATFGVLFQNSTPRIRTLIVGAGEKGAFIHRLLDSPLSPYDVRGFLDDDPAKQGKLVDASAVLAGIDQLEEIAARTWSKTVILATSKNRQPALAKRVLDVRLRGINVLEMPTVYEKLTGRVPVSYIEDDWLLFAEGFYLLSKEYVQRVKRLMDILCSSLLLLLFSPVMLLTGALIRIDSPGPVFYRQERVGKRGEIFKVIKFRAMRTDAEAGGAQWARQNDPRVTRVGKVIRLLRIDETPQLWNILKGEMSLIGPRPERPEFVTTLESKIPYYSVRHSVTPGVTGWAQVNYPYGSSIEDALNKLEYDLYYIKNMSIFLDIKILLRTIGVILLGQGAR